MPSEESFASGFGNGVRPVFRNCAFATERGKETPVFARFFEERENVERVLAQYLCARYSGDPLHGAIPDGVAAGAIKREDAVDAGVEQASKKKVFFDVVQEWSGNCAGIVAFGGVLIVAHLGGFVGPGKPEVLSWFK